jgi:PleD family two-component response regulator
MTNDLNDHPVGYILVVGEELIDKNELTEMLNRQGYTVLYSFNAFDALNILTRIRPKMIVIGFVKGIPDRQTFTKILKNDPDTSDISVVAISEEDSSLSELMPIGFDGFITVREKRQRIANDLTQILTK